jgi:lipoprotein signal peptidase
MRWFLFTAGLILIDQLTKFAVSHLGWSIFFNDQFAFSLPVPVVVMFAIYILVLVGISFYVFRAWNHFDNLQRWAWVLVYAGGLSNILERIVLGHVRDFIYIANGILNVADLYILAGLILLLISQRYSLKKAMQTENN